MQTKTIGEILREEREFHRLTIDEVAKRTRIRPEHLQALENNEFHSLPAAAFVKGYIRAYGQLFGFDHQPVLGILRRDFKESARGQLVPREFIKPMLRRRRVWAPITYILVGLVTVLLGLVSYVVFQWYLLQKPPMLEIKSPEQNAVVGPQIVVEGTAAVDSVVRVNTQPVTLQPDGNFTHELIFSREGLTTVTIEAVDRRNKPNLIQRTVTVKF